MVINTEAPKRKTKSLRLQIGILYSFLALVNILFFSVMIFENQTELLVKNFQYQSDNFVTSVMSDLSTKSLAKENDQSFKTVKERLFYNEITQFTIFDKEGNIWYKETGIITNEPVKEDILKKSKEISDKNSVFSNKYKLELNKEDFAIRFLIPLKAEEEGVDIFLYTELSIKSMRDRLTKLYYQIAIAFVWGLISHVLFGIYI